MTSLADLYAELKTDVVALADPLIEESQQRLRARHDFLPHAAALNAEGRVVLVGAMTGSRDGHANAGHILPMLHKGLRQMSREKVLVAVAIAARVTLTRATGPLEAIKVLIEHERGLNVALFQPFRATPEGAYDFAEPFVTPAAPELSLWTPLPPA